MDAQRDAVRSRLVIAAIECLEKEGMHGVRVRSIARQAGVNAAAINYYFGNKETLIGLALEQALQEAFINNSRQCFEQMGLAPLPALRRYCLDTLEGGLRHPRLTKAFFSGSGINETKQISMTRRFQTLIDYLQKHLHPVVAAKDRADMPLRLMQLLGVVIFAAIDGALVRATTGIDLSNDDQRQRYIDLLLVRFFPSHNIGEKGENR